jgi:hypothetical protein
LESRWRVRRLEQPGREYSHPGGTSGLVLRRALRRHARGGHHEENRQRFRDTISKVPKNLLEALRKLLKKSLERIVA